MPISNWNDLRFLLAVNRGRTLAAAARRLSVDNTTVARRITALESTMAAQFVQRMPTGTLQMTPVGEIAIRHAEAIEREIGLLNSEVDGADGDIAGTVRLTSVPMIVNRLLVPSVGAFLHAHPALDLELNADAQNLSLTRREADMALRLARPQVGGNRVKARRIGTLKYAVYAAASCQHTEARDLAWISYDESLSHLPQASWMVREARDGESRMARLRVNDMEAVMEAVAAGLGRSLLPCIVAGNDPRFRRVGGGKHNPLPEREVWLLVHTDLTPLARIVAVTQWLEDLLVQQH